MNISLLITFLMILGITIFAMQNGIPLEVKFLLWGFKSSLVAVIFGSSLVGAAIIAVITIPRLVKKHISERKLTKQFHKSEKKVFELERQLKEKDVKE
jgi:uncharacterized integral membrane protein